jgi:hypothetical protein
LPRPALPPSHRNILAPTYAVPGIAFANPGIPPASAGSTAHDLSFTLQPDGSRHARFEVVAETIGVNGKQADRSDRSFSVDLKPDQYAAALAGGVGLW